jgi:hypothetical protein
MLRHYSRFIVAIFVGLATAWVINKLLHSNLLLKLALDSLDFNQEHLCVDHIRLLGHIDQTW